MFVEKTKIGPVEMWFENLGECKAELHISTHRAHKIVTVRFENSNGAASFRREATSFSILGGDDLTNYQRQIVAENFWTIPTPAEAKEIEDRDYEWGRVTANMQEVVF